MRKTNREIQDQKKTKPIDVCLHCLEAWPEARKLLACPFCKGPLVKYGMTVSGKAGIIGGVPLDETGTEAKA